MGIFSVRLLYLILFRTYDLWRSITKNTIEYLLWFIGIFYRSYNCIFFVCASKHFWSQAFLINCFKASIEKCSCFAAFLAQIGLEGNPVWLFVILLRSFSDGNFEIVWTTFVVIKLQKATKSKQPFFVKHLVKGSPPQTCKMQKWSTQITHESKSKSDQHHHCSNPPSKSSTSLITWEVKSG